MVNPMVDLETSVKLVSPTKTRSHKPIYDIAVQRRHGNLYTIPSITSPTILRQHVDTLFERLLNGDITFYLIAKRQDKGR